MIVPFKIALTAALFMFVFWFAAKLTIRAFGSPFPRVTSIGDLWGGAFVLIALLCLVVALFAAAYGIVVL